MCFHDFDMVTRDAVSMWVDERKEEAEDAQEDGAGAEVGEAQALRLKMFTDDVTQQLLSFILAEEESTEEETDDDDDDDDETDE